MKQSKRERVLILILIITIMVYAAFKFGPSLNFLSLDTLREEYTSKSAAYNEMTQNIVMKSKHEENLNTITGEINDLKVISDLRQEQLIVFLNSYLAANNIDASNISFTDIAPVSITSAAAAKTIELSSLDVLMNEINGSAVNEAADKTAGQSQPADGGSSPTVSRISATITFEGTYSNMLKFIDSIQNNPVDISITNINTIVSQGDMLQGTMILNFYEIPKPVDFKETNTDWLWTDLAQSGKANPFSTDAAVFAVASGNYDFYMSVVPESSDLPTIMLGKAGDPERSTYVYADSNSVENIALSFNKENDKYYFKYNTKNSAYPSMGGWAEFVPVKNGNINIKIYSSKRNSNADSSGANISVNNASGLSIRVDIEGDDTSNQRIYFKEPRALVVTRK